MIPVTALAVGFSRFRPANRPFLPSRLKPPATASVLSLPQKRVGATSVQPVERVDRKRLGFVALDCRRPSEDVTRDAWIIEREDHLALRLARQCDPEPLHVEETVASFAIDWTGPYPIKGAAFIYPDRDTGRTTTVIGYPT
jgi:hypothetical protein